MTIFIDENIPFLVEALRANQEQGFILKSFQGRSLTKEMLHDCFALLVRSTTTVNAALLQNTPVQFIGTATSGSEHIDKDFLHEQGVFFRDARGCNANSVAEYVIFSMLLWAEKRGFMRSKQALCGKTLGVIGCGYIGQRVCELAQRLGMRVITNDPPRLEEGRELPFGTESVRLATLISEADCITNHVPLTHLGKHRTDGMFNAEVLANIRPESFFIHASRGDVVVESVLLDALEQTNIYAAVDVWTGEPSINVALAKRCMLATPHIAGYSYEGKVKGAIMMAQELEYFIVNIMGKPLTVDWCVFEKALEQTSAVSIDYTNHEELLRELRVSRALEQDTALLIASLDGNVPAVAFDTLRKTYPKRREILR